MKETINNKLFKKMVIYTSFSKLIPSLSFKINFSKIKKQNIKIKIK